MTTELATYKPNIISSMEDIEKAAMLMAKSGFFTDTTQMAQAAVKIMAGQEIGVGTFAAMTGIHIIKGRPAIGANIMAAKVKGSDKYDYRVDEMSDTACRITFQQYYKGELREIGKSEFTIADARKAGTQNLDKYPRNMLFARAISNGVKWFTPDVFLGVTVYTPEEMGAAVNEDGDVIDVVPHAVTVTPVVVTATAQIDADYPALPADWQAAKAVNDTPAAPNSKPMNGAPRPYTPEDFKVAIAKQVTAHANKVASPAQVGLTAMLLDIALMDEGKDARHTLAKWLFDKASLNEVSGPEVLALLKWLNAQKDSGGDYKPGQHVATEAKAAFKQALIDEGQTVLPM